MARPSSIPGLDARSSLRHAAQELLAARLADLRAHEEGARTLSIEAIHDLRVATRRLRAGLEVLCQASAPEVESLGKALGEVRDLQIELDWLETRASDPEERDRVGRALRDKLAAAGAKLQRALDRWSRRDAARVVRVFGKARASGRLGGAWGASLLQGDLTALKPKLKSLRAAIAPEETHALRKKVKKLKYEAELFRDAYPRTVRKWTAALSALQVSLGDTHDADLRCRWLDHNRAASDRLRDLAAQERAEVTRRLARELKSWQRQDRLRTLRRSLWD
jgi:CHAD domain-containing protein